MVALCTRGCEDGRIRNRRDVVAADRTRQAGCHGHDQHGGRCIAEYRNSDRDQDAERAPGGTGGKGQTERDEEEYRWHEHTDGGFRLHHRGYEAADVEVLFTADTGQRPRERQDEDGRNHCLESLGECLTELTKGQHLARDVQHKGKQQRKERAEHQRGGRIAVCERLNDVRAFQNAAGVQHACNAEHDQYADRQDQVVNLARSGYNVSLLNQREIVILMRKLVLFHRAEVEISSHQPDEERQREQRVQVQRDGLEEQREAVQRARFRQGRANRRRPRGDRRDDADRSRRCIDDVRQLCPGNAVLVRHRAHDRADGEAVEVIVHENEHSEERGRKRRAAPAANGFDRPLTVCA